VATAGTGTTVRMFLQAPDVVVNRSYAAILVGSGDREKPLADSGLDRFYMFKDKETATTVTAGDGTALATWPLAGDATAFNNMVDIANVAPAEAKAGLSDPGNNGWFRALAPGEKVVNAALTAAGLVYFSTRTPSPPSLTCGSNLGVARTYGLRFQDGAAGRDLNGDGVRDERDVAVTLTGGGLPPSAVAGLVNVLDSATGRTVVLPYVIGAGGTAGGQPGSASQNAPAKIEVKLSKKRRKTYWFINANP
ncbi:MAG: hypothetical protein ABI831_14500, partial [Betaproteobacteria bacterium]